MSKTKLNESNPKAVHPERPPESTNVVKIEVSSTDTGSQSSREIDHRKQQNEAFATVAKKNSTVLRGAHQTDDHIVQLTSSDEYLDAMGKVMQHRPRSGTHNNPKKQRVNLDSSASYGESLKSTSSHTDVSLSSGSISSDEDNANRPSTSQPNTINTSAAANFDDATISTIVARSATMNKRKAAAQNSEAATRIRRELKEIIQNPPLGCTANIVGDDSFHWHATIDGPENTVYEGGIFSLDIRFPPAFPFRPPRIRFITRIYHCNVDSRGLICLDVLNEKWSPALTVSKVLLSIWLLLGECNPDDPLVMAIAEQYNNHRAEHDKVARQWTKRYAKIKEPNELVAVTEPTKPEESAEPETKDQKNN